MNAYKVTQPSGSFEKDAKTAAKTKYCRQKVAKRERSIQWGIFRQECEGNESKRFSWKAIYFNVSTSSLCGVLFVEESFVWMRSSWCQKVVISKQNEYF